MNETVAVLDVGKSNVKLALVDARANVVLFSRTVQNTVRTDGPYPHYDVEEIWQWVLSGLAAFAADHRVDTIATTTHGACFVPVAGDDLALPVLDYEFPDPQSISAEYDAIRGDFAETLSPSLPVGLNAGRQLYWLQRTFPDQFARTSAILPYPQYWVMRLTGRQISEVTSFGAHTDLWNPRAATYSALATDRGWARLIPDNVPAWETVGTILPEVAAATGLPGDCRVLAGVHDSNAALLPHILARPLPFAVLSTGTWMVTFAPGGSLDGLDPARDCLANVDVFARAVPSAMCMAGREFEILVDGAVASPGLAEMEEIVSTGRMALPSFVSGSGPFGQRTGGWSSDPADLSPAARVAAASLYVALLADTCLRLTGAAGPVIVEGPFARNDVFVGALAQLAGRDILASPSAAGTTLGASLLALGPTPRPLPDIRPAAPIAIDLTGYAAAWHERAAG